MTPQITPVEVITFLRDIPGEFWMAIAAIIPALMVIATNKSNERLQQDRINSEQQSKDAERLYSLRREIYLDTVTRLGHASTTVINLLYKPPGTVDLLLELAPLMESMQKAQLVATVQTSSAASNCMGAILALGIKAIKRAEEINHLRGTILEHESEIEKLAQKSSGTAPEFIQAHIDLNNAIGALNTMFENFSILQNQEALAVSNYTTQFIVALKSDLGIEANLEEFNEHFKEFKQMLFTARDGSPYDLAITE